MGGEKGGVMREESTQKLHDTRGGRGKVIEFEKRVPEDLRELIDL